MSILVACLNVIPNRCIAKSTAPPPPALALTSQNLEPVHMNSKSLPSAVTCHRVDRMLLRGMYARSSFAKSASAFRQSAASSDCQRTNRDLSTGMLLPQTPTCYSSQRDGEFKYRKTGKHVLILLTIRSSQINSRKSCLRQQVQTW